MKLHIDDSKTIAEIQKEFVDAFEYIKIEFFTKAHKPGETSAKKDMIEASKKLGEIRTIHNEGDLTITKDMLVSDVEEAFENSYGVHVQIFRKQNEVWLLTTNTDNWTLEKQIEEAKFMSSPAE
ncbi:MAG: hypothetical protein P1U41_09145 [Vicingaceae bacterium]|nr:hypothetical protein [Vicingaceae bacterium]